MNTIKRSKLKIEVGLKYKHKREGWIKCAELDGPKHFLDDKGRLAAVSQIVGTELQTDGKFTTVIDG
jgi:hypothetical protein